MGKPALQPLSRVFSILSRSVKELDLKTIPKIIKMVLGSVGPEDLAVMIQNDWYTLPSYIHYKLGLPIEWCPIPSPFRRILIMIMDAALNKARKLASKNPDKLDQYLNLERFIQEICNDESLEDQCRIILENMDWTSIDLALTRSYLLRKWDELTYMEYVRFMDRTGYQIPFPDYLIYLKCVELY